MRPKEPVYRVIVGLLVAGQPDEVYVPLEALLYLAARVHVVHVAVYYRFQHHAGVVRAAPVRLVKLEYALHVDAVQHGVDYAHGVILRNVLVDSLREKYNLLGCVRAKVYLCHTTYLNA